MALRYTMGRGCCRSAPRRRKKSRSTIKKSARFCRRTVYRSMQKGISLPGEMVLQLTQLQDDLYRHICVLCADVERAKDILQETNLEICAKYPTFDETKGTFKA